MLVIKVNIIKIRYKEIDACCEFVFHSSIFQQLFIQPIASLPVGRNSLITTLLELAISPSANQNTQFIQSSLQSLETNIEDENELFIIRCHIIRELIHCKIYKYYNNIGNEEAVDDLAERIFFLLQKPGDEIEILEYLSLCHAIAQSSSLLIACIKCGLMNWFYSLFSSYSTNHYILNRCVTISVEFFDRVKYLYNIMNR